AALKSETAILELLENDNILCPYTTAEIFEFAKKYKSVAQLIFAKESLYTLFKGQHFNELINIHKLNIDYSSRIWHKDKNYLSQSNIIPENSWDGWNDTDSELHAKGWHCFELNKLHFQNALRAFHYVNSLIIDHENCSSRNQFEL